MFGKRLPIKSFLSLGFLILCCNAFAATVYSTWTVDQLENDGFVQYASTDELELYLNIERAIFAVRKVDSGYVWYSSPIDWESDNFASGYNKNALPSMIQINTKDDTGSFYPSNSYINSVSRDGLEVVGEDGGFTLNYDFPRDGFYIPLHVTLDGDSLVVTVNFSEIEEEEVDPDSTLSALMLLDITVLPYFGAAPKGEEGYIFVPDGTGAVIEFDNTRSSSAYEQYVYGRDRSIIPSMKKTVEEDVYLPVFGMSRENAGFIAVIEGYKANGVISAETAGQTTLYNAVKSRCIIRDVDTFTFRERTGSLRDIRIFEDKNLPESTDSYTVRYLFLDGDDATYVGMANAYRGYLQSKELFPTEKTSKKFSMDLNFIGSGAKKKAVLGIPQNVNIAYTPFSDVSATIDTLKEAGVDNFVVKYDGWIKGGIFGKYPSSPKPEGNLGGRGDFKDLLGYMTDNGIDFYAGADFVNLYKSDLGHIKELTSNREINRSPVKVPDFRQSTFDERTTGDTYPNWILRLSAVAKNFNKFFTKFNNKYEGVGLAPDSLGNVVGSDFGRKNGSTRTQTLEGFKEILDDTSSTNPVMLSAPFDYAFSSVSYICDAPTISSSYEIEDYAVPFYQIVLKGYIPFSNFPGNRDLDEYEYVLKLLETGADMSYLWITQNQDELRDSRLQSYMSVYADDWISEAADVYNELKPILGNVSGQTIVSHEVYSNGGRITVYENGYKILTNYSDKTVTIDGLTAQPYSYAVGRDA